MEDSIQMENILSKPNGIEHPDVQNVIEIAEELGKKNKIIQIDLLYKISKRRLKLESETIYSIIDLLLRNYIIVEGSKYTKRTVILNKNRYNVYNFIKTYPGVHFSVIKREVLKEGSSGHFIWHLNALKKFNYIKEVKVKNYTLFLPAEMDEEFGIFFFLLRDNLNRKIIKYLVNEEPVETAQIPSKVLESKGSVYYHVNTMKEYNILKAQENGITHNEELTINSEKKELLIQIIDDIDANKF